MVEKMNQFQRMVIVILGLQFLAISVGFAGIIAIFTSSLFVDGMVILFTLFAVLISIKLARFYNEKEVKNDKRN